MLELMGRHSSDWRTPDLAVKLALPCPQQVSRINHNFLLWWAPAPVSEFISEAVLGAAMIDYSPLAWHPSRLRANAHNSTTLTTQEKRSWQRHSSSRLMASQQSGPWHLALRAATESKGSAHSQARTNSLSSHNLGGKNRTWRSPIIENKENFSKDSCLPFRGVYWVSAVVKK